MGDGPNHTLARVTRAHTRSTLSLPRDQLDACRVWIAQHSKSFYLSSWLLPRHVREASWALYAFCRRADDAVDEVDLRSDPLHNVKLLRARLDDVYRGSPPEHPIDRAFARVAQHYEIPAALPAALLDGMQMDALEQQYETIDDLLLYCFRVASVVGLMMTCVMLDGARAPRVVWLRAADLGIAMQLTNIARDIGEDARRARVYAPRTWLSEAELTRDALFALDRSTPATVEITHRLLALADDYYAAADRGVLMLPRTCRLAIASSRHIYAAIGERIARNEFDSITRRAFVPLGAKLRLVAKASTSVWRSLSADDCVASGPSDPRLWEWIADTGLEDATVARLGA